jgi:hypothetical protein
LRYALKEFEKAVGKQKELVVSLGSNRTIIDKNLHFFIIWLLPIRNNVEKFNAELTRLEPQKLAWIIEKARL